MMDFYRRNPYTGRKETVIKNNVAVKDYWTVIGDTRVFIAKGTKVDNDGCPVTE